MSKKSNEQMLEELRQRMNRDKLRERELTNRINAEKRKKRNHALIVIATEFLRGYGSDVEEVIINSSDDDVRNWVRSELNKIRNNSDEQIYDQNHDCQY